jgi:hypothetical protein
MKIVDKSGEVHGGLTILRKDPEDTKEHGRAHYWCLCEHCGQESLHNAGVFRKNKPPVSCGCRRKAGFTNKNSHGKALRRESRLLNYARRNAKRREEVCELTIKDIVIPEVCPVLGIELSAGNETHQDFSPSVDRIDSTKGYTKDNIWIISQRANRIKNNATLEEIGMLYEALKSLRKDRRCVSD